MAKYSAIELRVKDGRLLGLDNLRKPEIDGLTKGNAVYVYRGTESGKVYIGQTKQFVNRHKQHYSGREEKFNTADFDRVIVVFSVYFNGSALDDMPLVK